MARGRGAIFAALACVAVAAAPGAAVRVGVVGGGIGGSAFSYFLSRDVKDLDLHVYEADTRLCGRVDSFTPAFSGSVEAGASVIHTTNAYAEHFVDILKLKKGGPAYDSSSKRLGVFDGSSFRILTTGYSLWDAFQFLRKYDFAVIRLNAYVERMLKDFKTIYKTQAKGQAFATPKELLDSMKMYNLTQITLKEHLMKTHRMPLDFMEELIDGIMRVNYGQDSRLNAFAGSVSLAGSSKNLWSVKGGNNQLCPGLLDISHAKLHTGEGVTRIEKTDRGTYLLRTTKNSEEEFDYVVIATPLSRAKIEFSGTSPTVAKYNMQRTVATFVSGTLSPKFFNEENLPNVILTTESKDNFFSSIGLVNATGPHTGLFKIFSRDSLSHEHFGRLFSAYDKTSIKEKVWFAYPTYQPPETFTSFVLDHRLYYINAIETAASAIEMSAISAKNAALLVSQDLAKGLERQQGKRSEL